MTGFGAASSHADGVDYHVELRTVNNRYLKTSLRLPEPLQPLEAEIEIALRKRLSRGTVSVRASVSETSAQAAQAINEPALRLYIERAMAASPIDPERITVDLGSLLSLPGVLLPGGDEDERLDRTRQEIMPLVDRACDALIEMREREGASLAEDLRRQQAFIAERVTAIEAQAPEVVNDYERRLKTRIEALVNGSGASLEPGDLVREIAVYAEKIDIAEEITRLRTHLDHFLHKIDGSGEEAVGRTLEFVAQELLREANTIASKSPDAEISRLAIEIKGAVDRIKEQVQNVE